ncbi:MAG: hydantoinase B/oxoprolinase family protein [Gemmatimonadota bacterium]
METDDTARDTVDPVALEVFRHLFTALAEEMGAALKRASFSPNIKERRDYSCALFAPDASAVALGDHMPVHLGAMPMSVQTALEELGTLAPGDIVALNDPFRGGTHLPDITLISAVYEADAAEDDAAGAGSGAILGGDATELGSDATERGGDATELGGRPAAGRLLGFVASRAHHSDVGGMSPGSMPLAREIYQEGLRIPPVKVYERGALNRGVWDLLLANVRTPVERAGDLDAQVAALHTGAVRLREIVGRRGAEETLAAMKALVGYADRLVGAGLERIPAGRYTARDVMESDGFGTGPVPIQVTLERDAKGLIIDFEGTSPQVPGGINAVAAITQSACRYVVRCVVEALLGEELPAGGGSMSSVRIRLPEGSLVNASLPASVAAGNVETSQRITDVLFLAFGEALPHLIPALSQGTMNNTTVGGVDPRTGQVFAYYETVGGGMGAGPQGDGLSGVHVHMSNSLNTPVEALEHAYPFRITRYEIRRDSGGTGVHRGGDGLRRDLQILTEARVALLTERRAVAPAGARGGAAGAPGENVLIRDGEEKTLPAKTTLEVQAGDIISIRSPGGGGWGTP